MRYFVVTPDGSQYGPADMHTLNAWAQQGRLLPHTMLRDESTGHTLAAGDLNGLSFTSFQSAPSLDNPGV